MIAVSSDEEPEVMRDRTIQALVEQLGQSSSSTDKVIRWNVKTGLDVVLQRDAASHRAIVWMPWPGEGGECPPDGEVYAAGRGRHSNTYGAPSLARGMAALKLTITNDESLSTLLARLPTAADGGKVQAKTMAEVVSAPIVTSPEPAQGAKRPPTIPQHSNDEEVTGLVIQSPWIDLILRGQKTWEIRKRRAATRSRIALIKSKSGCAVGTCRVVDCLGPLSKDQILASSDQHRIPAEKIDQYWEQGKTYSWVLAEPCPLQPPIPYQHPSGAVIWVTLTAKNVPDRFDELVAATR